MASCIYREMTALTRWLKETPHVRSNSEEAITFWTYGTMHVLCICGTYTAPVMAPPGCLKVFLCGGPHQGTAIRDKFCSETAIRDAEVMSSILDSGLALRGHLAITVCLLSGSRTCQPGCNIFAVLKAERGPNDLLACTVPGTAGLAAFALQEDTLSLCWCLAFPSWRAWRVMFYAYMWIMALFPQVWPNPRFSFKKCHNMPYIWVLPFLTFWNLSCCHKN